MANGVAPPKKLPKSGVYFPYCDFSLDVGGQLVNITRDANGIPDRLIRFNCNRLFEATGITFDISIFDPEWVFVENMLVASNFNCAFQYGWYSANGDENIGPVWYCQISKVNIDLKINGCVYTISGVGTGPMDVSRLSKSYGGNSIKISDIVKQVVKEQGWKEGNIDETETLVVPTGKTTQTEEKRFTRCNETPLEFLNRLIPYAVRASDGAAGYVLFFDNRTNPPTLNFAPRDWENGKGSPRQTSKEQNRTFNYCLDTESEIISLSFTNDFYGAWIRNMAGGSGSTVPNFTPINRLDQTEDGGNPKVSYNHLTYAKDQIQLRQQFLNQHEQVAAARQSMASVPSSGIGLEMEIFGDPRIMVNDSVNINIQMPGQGILHHASGTWWVHKVLDEISNGAFKTKLSCINQYKAYPNNTTVGQGASAGSGAGAGGAGATGGQPPAGWSGGGNANSAYDRVKQMQGDKYTYSQENRFGSKSRDCSSLVMDVAGYSGAISAEDKQLIKDGGTAAGIAYNLEQKYTPQVTNSLSGMDLKEGMIIAIDRSSSQDGVRYQGIDHIAMVVENKNTGKMEIVDMGVSRGVASTDDPARFDRTMRYQNGGHGVTYRVIDTTKKA